MKVRFIVNPAAGKVNRPGVVTDTIREVLSDVEGLFDIKVPRTRPGARLFSTEARDAGFDAVFACGGDGTINEVAGPLVGSSTALGVVPMGSGNGFALSLGLPMDVVGAVSLVRSWKTRPIDVGEVCGRYFFSTAGLGFDALLSMRYNTGSVSSRRRGLLPYVPLALKEYLFYRPETVVVKVGNERTPMRPFLFTVANTPRYGGGAVIAPGALPDDGFLDVAVLGPLGPVGALGTGLRLLSGNIDKSRRYSTFRVQSLEVLRKVSTLVHADGEPFEWGGSVPFSVHPKSLKVLIP